MGIPSRRTLAPVIPQEQSIAAGLDQYSPHCTVVLTLHRNHIGALRTEIGTRTAAHHRGIAMIATCRLARRAKVLTGAAAV